MKPVDRIIGLNPRQEGVHKIIWETVDAHAYDAAIHMLKIPISQEAIEIKRQVRNCILGTTYRRIDSIREAFSNVILDGHVIVSIDE